MAGLSATHQPIKVLHIFGQMNRGGAEMRTLDIMRRVDRDKFKNIFCVLSGKAGDLDKDIYDLGGSVVPCVLGPTFPVDFIRLLRREKIDVVHSHVHLFSGAILALAAWAKIPVRIAHFRSTSSRSERNHRQLVQDKIMRVLLNRYATHLIGNGNGSLAVGWRSDWQNDPRCSVIHNGLDPMPFESAPDSIGVRAEFGWPEFARLVIHVGRMDPPKNYPRLMDIVAGLMKLDDNVCFLGVGRTDESMKAKFLLRFQEQGLAGRIAFAGLRFDVPRLLRAADLMIFPSLWEGLPGAILEACAAGVPVLGTDLPGICEIAGQFSLVKTMSLSLDDTSWANQANRLLRQEVQNFKLKRSTVEFRRSIYDINLCVKAHELIWSSESGTEVKRLYNQNGLNIP